jgi:hypothetical protein
MEPKEIIITPIQNLMMNLGSGLLPENLSDSEVELLEIKYGPDWFEKLGYNDESYNRPHPSRGAVSKLHSQAIGVLSCLIHHEGINAIQESVLYEKITATLQGLKTSADLAVQNQKRE